MIRSNKYKAFGLILNSKLIHFPELLNASDNLKSNVVINEKYEQWPKIPDSKINTPFLRIIENDLRISIEGIGDFRVHNGNEITFKKDKIIQDPNDLSTFILGSVLGALLIQRNFFLLHGNALEKDGKAIVCLGGSGYGKSTLAYVLSKYGWRLIADDMVAITNDGLVLPGIPRIKLWYDAIKESDLDINKFNSVREGLNKYILTKESVNCFYESVQLEGIYRIGNFRTKEISLYQDSGSKIESEKLKTLILRNNIFKPRFVRGLGKESMYFQKIINLVKNYEFYSMQIPYGIRKLDELVKLKGLSGLL